MRVRRVGVTSIPTFRLLTGMAVGALWPGRRGHRPARSLGSQPARSVAERTRLADHFARELSWDAVGRRAMEIYEQVLVARRSVLATSS